MFGRVSSSRRDLAVWALLILLAFVPATVGAQDKSKRKATPKGTPVLWREPGDVAGRDLFLGPGGASMRPNLRRITFLKQETGGYSTKYRVRDASGREWVAKVGKEAQSETAAVRLLWAAGYVTEINYLAPRADIRGKGVFRNVRFEARPKSVERLDEWEWDENPFKGTREFQGLKVMMVLFNNWDIKDENNKVLHVSGGRRDELHYVVSDLGATFGKTGSLPLFWRITRSRNDPAGYEDAKFIDGVEDDGRVNFRYGGKSRDLFKDVSIEDARWIGGRLSRLSDRQLADAFRAANYTPREVRTLARAVRERINELVNLRK